MVAIKQKFHFKALQDTMVWFLGTFLLITFITVLSTETLSKVTPKFHFLQTWPISAAAAIIFLGVLSRWKSLIISAIISAVIISLGVVIAYELPKQQVQYLEMWLDTLQAGAVVAICISGTLISFSCLATSLRKTFYLVAPKPILKMNENGISYHDGIFRVIKWDEIEKYQVASDPRIGVLIQLHIKKFPTVVQRLSPLKKLFWSDILRLSDFDFIYEFKVFPTNYETDSNNIKNTLATYSTKSESEMTTGFHHPDSERLNEQQQQFAKTLRTEARQPVWSAISDLFLDTDVSLHYESTAQDLAKSPYTISELNNIYKREVAPICYVNLFSVAGAWSGIDQEWLEVVIIKRLYNYNQCKPLCIFHLFNDRFCTFMTKKDWNTVINKVKEIRKETSND